MTTNLDAVTLTPPRVSLLSAADIVPVDGHRWESGFSVWTEGCEVAYIYEICPDAESTMEDVDGAGDRLDYRPYLVYASDGCTTFSNRDFKGRATRKLILAESTKLERELWLGEAGGNPFLSDAPTTIAVAGTQTPSEAIAILDQELGECSAGRGMIHIRPILLASLLETSTVRREGNVYLSPMDNIVVPGRGYPGTGPADQAVGATEWIYANTGIVQIRHSEIVYTGLAEDGVQRQWNDREVRAQRVSHVALDTDCCVLTIEIGVGGSF